MLSPVVTLNYLVNKSRIEVLWCNVCSSYGKKFAYVYLFSLQSFIVRLYRLFHFSLHRHIFILFILRSFFGNIIVSTFVFIQLSQKLSVKFQSFFPLCEHYEPWCYHFIILVYFSGPSFQWSSFTISRGKLQDITLYKVYLHLSIRCDFASNLYPYIRLHLVTLLFIA
jgi:hypothetical protein